MIAELRWMVGHSARTASGAPARLRYRLGEWRRFWSSYYSYRRLCTPTTSTVRLEHLYPCLGDSTGATVVEPTYFFQDAWAFERIVASAPPRHVDVGSHHRFVSFLSKVVPTTMIDLRPLSVTMPSIDFIEGSITSLPFEDGSLPSVSSICVVEHIGLGRYGDSLDPRGTEKALAELKRVVSPGGNLYLSLPLDDDDREYFNAHRAFAEETVMSMFAPFEVVESRYIYGNEFVYERRGGFGTGCYHLRRRPD